MGHMCCGSSKEDAYKTNMMSMVPSTPVIVAKTARNSINELDDIGNSERLGVKKITIKDAFKEQLKKWQGGIAIHAL